MPVVNAVLGVVLLLFGLQLYWVLVAIAGFFVGLELAESWLIEQAQWVRLVAALCVGGIGALIALLAQRVAFALAGLLASGYLALAIAQPVGNDTSQLVWFLVGGVLGAILAAWVMDWAIIVLSSLVGATAVTSALPLTGSPLISGLILLALAAIGIVFQARHHRVARTVNED